MVKSLEFFSNLQQVFQKCALVKIYSISSVRLQRTMQIACVLRSVLIAYLITLSLEHDIIVVWKKF